MTFTALKLLLKQPIFWVKTIVSILVLTAIIYAGHAVYSWIYDRGADSLRPALAEAQRELADYKDSYQTWLKDSDEARKTFAKEQLDLQADLKKRLTDAERRASQREVIYREKEVVRYVPADVDARTVLPLGFVWLYSETLQGEAATRGAFGAFSDGPGGTAGTDSGIRLSEFAYIAGHNNVACLRYRDRVKLWETWYFQSKSQHDRARQITEEAAPSTP